MGDLPLLCLGDERAIKEEIQIDQTRGTFGFGYFSDLHFYSLHPLS
jgi:hypothetical protein